MNNKQKRVNVSFLIPVEVDQQLRLAAAEMCTTKSEVMRLAVVEWLRGPEAEQADTDSRDS